MPAFRSGGAPAPGSAGMIILSCSLPKSASSLVVRYELDLLERSTLRNGQAAFEAAFGSRYIHRLTPAITLRLGWLMFRHGTFVVKTHMPPTASVRLLIALGLARATYSYRDPRDVILSLIDHGRRSAKSRSGKRPFVEFDDVIGSIRRVRAFLKSTNEWERFGRALFIRYEDLMTNKLAQLQRMNQYLGTGIDDAGLRAIIAHHERIKARAWNFNKGTSFRYREEMTAQEQRETTEAFREFLEAHGYDVDTAPREAAAGGD